MEFTAWWQALHTTPAFLSLMTIVGLCVGSFLNLAVYRLSASLWNPTTEHQETSGILTLISPPSCCPHCHTALRWWHNIPLISFLWLRGRCADCQQAISWQYPLLEVIVCTLALALTYFISDPATFAIWFICGNLLLALSVTDIRWQLLPDTLTLSLLWFGLLVNTSGFWVNVPDAIYGAAAGYLGFSILDALYYHLRGEHGLGGGDPKFIAALGACFGWQALLPIILIASLSGCIFVLLQRAFGNMSRMIAFGPFLAFGALIAVLLRDRLPWIFWTLL